MGIQALTAFEMIIIAVTIIGSTGFLVTLVKLNALLKELNFQRMFGEAMNPKYLCRFEKYPQQGLIDLRGQRHSVKETWIHRTPRLTPREAFTIAIAAARHMNCYIYCTASLVEHPFHPGQYIPILTTPRGICICYSIQSTDNGGLCFIVEDFGQTRLEKPERVVTLSKPGFKLPRRD